jgi:hypothetical protein
MDGLDRALITKMCENFNIPVTFREEDTPAFLLGHSARVELELPSDDNEEKWTVTRIEVIPGVRYTSNGDGWPDDVDVSPVFVSSALVPALVEAVKLAVEIGADEFVESSVRALGEELEGVE